MASHATHLFGLQPLWTCPGQGAAVGGPLDRGEARWRWLAGLGEVRWQWSARPVSVWWRPVRAVHVARRLPRQPAHTVLWTMVAARKPKYDMVAAVLCGRARDVSERMKEERKLRIPVGCSPFYEGLRAYFSQLRKTFRKRVLEMESSGVFFFYFNPLHQWL